MTKPAPDLFAAPSTSAVLPVDVATGLAQLATAQPLWPIGAADWTDLIARVTAFAWRWDAPARAAGWTTLDLYGADRRAPGARVGNLGAAFLVARSVHSVLEVGRDAITVVTRAGSRLRVFRRAPDPICALAWDLCRDPANSANRGAWGAFLTTDKGPSRISEIHQLEASARRARLVAALR